MKYTISILVENHPGVLSRVSGLFSRRSFNIDSLAVGVTDDPTVSRITIIVDGNEYTVEQVEKQLNKLIDVIKLKTLSPADTISRELMLVKVAAGANERGEIMNIVRIMEAKICNISRTTMTLEVSDTTERLETMLELLRPYGLREVIRTGTIATQKGSDSITVKNNN